MALVIEYRCAGKLLRKARVTDPIRNVISLVSSSLRTYPAHTEAEIRDEEGSLLSTIISNNGMAGLNAY